MKVIHYPEIRNRRFTGIYIDKHGGEIYYRNGKYHREDGPCYISVSGNPCFALKGRLFYKEIWFSKLSEEQKMEALFNFNEWNQRIK